MNLNKTILILVAGIAFLFFSCKQDEPRACFRLSTDYILVDSVVQFISCSEGATSYLWDFGDNTTSTEASPEHVYQYSDYFEVSLTVEGNDGEFNNVLHEITVYQLDTTSTK